MTREKLTDKEVANSKSEKIMNAVAWYCGYYRKNPQRFAKEYLNLNLKLFQQILLYLMVRSTGFCFIAARGQIYRPPFYLNEKSGNIGEGLTANTEISEKIA